MNRADILDRNIVDEKTVISNMRYGNITIFVKSVFNGDKHIGDLLFNIAKEKINNEKSCENFKRC